MHIESMVLKAGSCVLSLEVKCTTFVGRSTVVVWNCVCVYVCVPAATASPLPNRIHTAACTRTHRVFLHTVHTHMIPHAHTHVTRTNAPSSTTADPPPTHTHPSTTALQHTSSCVRLSTSAAGSRVHSRTLLCTANTATGGAPKRTRRSRRTGRSRCQILWWGGGAEEVTEGGAIQMVERSGVRRMCRVVERQNVGRSKGKQT